LHKYLKFIALSLLAAAILFWFGRSLDWDSVSRALRQSDWRLILLAAAIIAVTYLVRAMRWRAFLLPLVPAGVSLRELFAATTVGFGAVFLIGRTAEVVRPAFLPLRDSRVRPGVAFVTIAVERIYDMVAVILLFAANLLFFRVPGGEAANFARVRQAGLVMLVVAIAGVGGLLILRRHAAWITLRLNQWFNSKPPLIGRAGRLLTGLLTQLAEALGVLVSARELLTTVGWTALLWAAIMAASLLVYRAFGLPVGLSETVFVLGWSLVGSLVPTPGGAAGTYHLATAAGLVFIGAVSTIEGAAAVAIVLHLVMFAPALVFALYYFLRSDISIARLRGLASSESAVQQEVADNSRPAASS